MKKQTLASLLAPLLVLLFIPANAAFATSGACSWHGGVNCSAGASYTGRAICNDGWESSTSYYLTSECDVPIVMCAAPWSAGCVDESSYQNMQMSYARTGMAGFMVDNLNLCRKQINDYIASKEKYRQCNIDWYGYDPVTGESSPSLAQREASASIAKAKVDKAASDRLSVAKSLVITTNYLPDAIPNKKYSADIAYNYNGDVNNVPLFQIKNLSDNFFLETTNIDGHNGRITLKLMPWMSGQIVIEVRAIANDIQVATKIFNISVKDEVKKVEIDNNLMPPAQKKEEVPVSTPRVQTPEEWLKTQPPKKQTEVATLKSSPKMEKKEYPLQGLQATTTQSKIETKEAPTTKHWYRWLNPFSWFK